MGVLADWQQNGIDVKEVPLLDTITSEGSLGGLDPLILKSLEKEGAQGKAFARVPLDILNAGS